MLHCRVQGTISKWCSICICHLWSFLHGPAEDLSLWPHPSSISPCKYSLSERGQLPLSCEAKAWSCSSQGPKKKTDRFSTIVTEELAASIYSFFYQKYEGIRFPELLVYFYQTTLCDILEDCNWKLFLFVFPKDLIEIICSLQVSMEHQTRRLQDLEDYLDTLLLRVMETTPRILQNPYVSCNTHPKLR